MEASMLSLLPPDRQFLWHVGQALRARVGDHQRLGQLIAPVAAPDTQNDVKSHARDQFRGLPWTQAYRPLTPVGRYSDADRVPDPRLLIQAVRSDPPVEGPMDSAAVGARTDRRQGCLH